MCAINGFNFIDEDLVLKMNQTSSHRGPDGTGFFVDEGVSLGHNRLSILDPRNVASQPMESVDGRFVIVFNGEIYNFKNLKKEIGNSYSFQTNSDTEVILAGFKKWGSEVVSKLNGIFSFAIWDKREKEIFLARDFAGVKPLYYYHNDGKFIFASEIKSILEHGVQRKINKQALKHYFRLFYVPEPLTLFENIYKFPRAGFARYKNNNLVIENYWNKKPLESISSVDAKDVKGVVERAVERQLISDKPLGVFLSGGIDSNVVLSSMSKVRGNIDTFAVGYDLTEEEEVSKFNADFDLARKSANYFGTNHHEVLLKPKEIPELVEKLVYHMDEPVANPTSIPMLKLSAYSKNQGMDVVLTGNGGDECFEGYPRYRLSKAASVYQDLFPTAIRSFLEIHPKLKKLNTPPGVERLMLFIFQKDPILKEILADKSIIDSSTKNLFEERYFEDVISDFEAQFADVDRRTWLVDESLLLTDKTAMASGLEARVPLLDKKVIEMALNIPSSKKLSLFDTKKILKNAFKDDLLPELVNAPKRGFVPPTAKWLRRPDMSSFAREILSPNFYRETNGIFNWGNVSKVLEEHIDKKNYNLHVIWQMITFQLWAKRFKVET